MITRFKQVDKNVFRGSAPNIEDVVILNKKIGIKKIISLDARAGNHISRSCRLLNIDHVIVPIDGEQKHSLINFLHHDIEKLLLDGSPSYIHCHYGKDRTGLAVALYRCKHDGWSAEKALKEAHSLGFGLGVDPKIVDLYVKIIHAAAKNKKDKDVNDASDIVDASHDLEQLQYADPATSAGIGLSWGPFHDYRIKRYPDNDPNIEYDEQYKARNDQEPTDISHLLNMHVSNQTIPQVGAYDQNTTMNGSGPSAVGNGIIT